MNRKNTASTLRVKEHWIAKFQTCMSTYSQNAEEMTQKLNVQNHIARFLCPKTGTYNEKF